jgi:transcriptional regulator with XRE-family HTH domain
LVSYILVTIPIITIGLEKEEVDMNLAKRIKDCRYAKGWGPDELAAKASISRTALYQIESGKTELPRAGTLRRLAKALEVSVDALLGNSDMPPGMELASFADPDGTADHLSHVSISEDVFASNGDDVVAGSATAQPTVSPWAMTARERDLSWKFRELLRSPLGEGIARVVEDSHRLLLPAIQTKRLG